MTTLATAVGDPFLARERRVRAAWIGFASTAAEQSTSTTSRSKGRHLCRQPTRPKHLTPPPSSPRSLRQHRFRPRRPRRQPRKKAAPHLRRSPAQRRPPVRATRWSMAASRTRTPAAPPAGRSTAAISAEQRARPQRAVLRRLQQQHNVDKVGVSNGAGERRQRLRFQCLRSPRRSGSQRSVPAHLLVRQR